MHSYRADKRILTECENIYRTVVKLLIILAKLPEASVDRIVVDCVPRIGGLLLPLGAEGLECGDDAVEHG